MIIITTMRMINGNPEDEVTEDRGESPEFSFTVTAASTTVLSLPHSSMTFTDTVTSPVSSYR